MAFFAKEGRVQEFCKGTERNELMVHERLYDFFKIPLVVKSKQELGTDELPSLSCKDSSVAPLPQCGGDQHGKLVVAQPDVGAR